MKILETENLIMRPWDISDAEDMYEYAKTPNVGPMAGWQPHKDIEESRKIIASFIENDTDWAIVNKRNNKVIGSVGLNKSSYPSGSFVVREVGYVLNPTYWGHGLAAECVKEVMRFAFTEFGVDMLCVRHYSFNLQSKRVIEKCGFRYEGFLRNYYQKDGNMYAARLYSLTKEEYLAKANK